MATLEDFNRWLGDLGRFTRDGPYIEEVGGERNSIRADRRVRVYTEVNRYSVYAVERFDGGPGYLGCVATGRKPRAGEDWTRGSDLADGPLDEETWQRVLADIVSYEMVRLSQAPGPRPGLRSEQRESAGSERAASLRGRGGPGR